ncbi:unnamed protein product [Alternaria alternata]
MTSPPASPNEKEFSGPCTRYSNASSSSTLRSSTTIKSLRHVANSFGLLLPRKKPTDVEQQADSTVGEDKDDEEDDGSIFPPGGSGPYPTKVRTLEKCPNGYARLAAFNASEQNFMLYRGFSNVHARLLLSHQASIQKLEAELDDMDRFHNTLPEASKKRLRSWDLDVAACRQEKEEAKEDGDEDEARTREDILEELRIKVNRYDELLIKARELISFQRPTERDYQSVRNWFHNSAPLVDEEQDYILWKEDIVTLRHGREWAGFDGMVEAMLHKIDSRPIQWLFRTDDQRRKSTDKRNYYFAPSRVSTLVNLCITVALFLLLVAPVLAMYRLSTIKTTECVFAAIGVLMVFTLLFAAAMSLLTKAKRHELFAAAAAYCAVLVVFVGSTNFN